MALLTLIRMEWIARDPKDNNPVTAILTEMEIRREHEKEPRKPKLSPKPRKPTSSPPTTTNPST